MVSVTSKPGLLYRTDAYGDDADVTAFVEKVRASELASCDRLSVRITDARQCVLVAEAWLRGGGDPWVAMGVRFIAEQILTGQLAQVEDGR